MSKSGHALRVDEVQHLVNPFLNRRGFVCRQRRFKKELNKGLLHLVEFQMARYTSMYYGKFTVNLGVFIPEIYHVIYGALLQKQVGTFHCELRQRLPTLKEGGKDKWWSSHDIETAADEISTLLLKYGFPYFEQLSSREAIYEAWRTHDNSIGLPPRGRLSMAIMMHFCGQTNTVIQLINNEIEEHSGTPYMNFVKDVAKRCGIIS